MNSRTRTLAMIAAAGVTAALIPAAVALHDSVATADPASTPTTSSAAPRSSTAPTSTTSPRTQTHLDTASLLQYRDVNNNAGLSYLSKATMGDDEGRHALSACTGEQTMADVAGSDTDRFYVAWTSAGDPLTVTEIAAELGDQAHARTTMQTLVRGQRDCQDEPAGHWRNGRAHTLREGTGSATWFAATDGDGTRNGGVVVARNGLHVAVVQVNGKAVSNAGLAQLARSAVDRLA